MPLIVEDGTVVAGANSYADEDDADLYFEDRPSSVWTAASSEDRVAALLYGASWLDARYDWLGSIVSNDQTLAWPRRGVMDADGRSIPEDEIPTAIIHAQIESALAALGSPLNEVRDRGGAIGSVTVAVISVEYMASATAGRTFPYIDSLVAKLAYPHGSGIIRTMR